jgi:uncharacterized membrane protein YfcA
MGFAQTAIMSDNPDVNKSFVGLACLIFAGGVISSLNGGGGSIFVALVMCYFMLVATNAIKRGENSRKGKSR